MEELLDKTTKQEIWNPFLIKYGLYSGAIPLIGGWSIFFLYLIFKFCNEDTSLYFAVIGFYWIGISLLIAGSGLLGLLIFTYFNWNNLTEKVWHAYGMLLVNIPCVFLILYLVFNGGSFFELS